MSQKKERIKDKYTHGDDDVQKWRRERRPIECVNEDQWNRQRKREKEREAKPKYKARLHERRVDNHLPPSERAIPGKYWIIWLCWWCWWQMAMANRDGHLLSASARRTVVNIDISHNGALSQSFSSSTAVFGCCCCTTGKKLHFAYATDT